MTERFSTLTHKMSLEKHFLRPERTALCAGPEFPTYLITHSAVSGNGGSRLMGVKS